MKLERLTGCLVNFSHGMFCSHSSVPCPPEWRDAQGRPPNVGSNTGTACHTPQEITKPPSLPTTTTTASRYAGCCLRPPIALPSPSSSRRGLAVAVFALLFSAPSHRLISPSFPSLIRKFLVFVPIGLCLLDLALPLNCNGCPSCLFPSLVVRNSLAFTRGSQFSFPCSFHKDRV
jgi:hypothetical protein